MTERQDLRRACLGLRWRVSLRLIAVPAGDVAPTVMASQLAFVDEHDGTVRSSCPVGKPEALVQLAGREVRLVDADVHGVRASFAGLAKSSLHERPPQALPSPGRSDIQFGQVALLAGAPDSGAEAEYGEPVWPVPG